MTPHPSPQQRRPARAPSAPRAFEKLDPRSPYVFDLRELGRQAGSLREYERVAPAPAGLGLEVVGIPEDSPVTMRLRLESATEGVLVTGTAEGHVVGQCARCLDPIRDDLVVDVQELFAYPDSSTDATTEDDELPRIVGERLDVEPVVRDAVVLALPWTPLCSQDCAGLCPECGQRLDALPPDHGHESIDPRWAALASFPRTRSSGSEPTDLSVAPGSTGS